jgi:ubiquinone/menaquinone biosynthesis C-methylase UbiE
VVLIHGDALDLPFPDERFEAVNCCGALHLFPDVPRSLEEIRRVLTPGGRFATAVYRRAGRGRFSRVGQSLDEGVSTIEGCGS